MNVVGYAPCAKAFASRVASDRGEVSVKSGADGDSEMGTRSFVLKTRWTMMRAND
jgi:hypothetical protein